MKKLIFVLLLFPSIVFGAFNNDLYYGKSNNEVKELQKFLTGEKLYSGPITGNFYSITLKAVKAFQSREKIFPVAGYFGPKTRLRANALLIARLAESAVQETAETTGETATPDSSVQPAMPKTKGCADNTAINYDSKAEENDGSCRYSNLTLSNYNAGDGNANEYYKIEATEENFNMEEFVFLPNKTFRSVQFVFFDKGGNSLGDNKEWLFAGIQCGEYDNPVVPQKCSENIGYKFYINKELGGQKSELTIPKNGYILFRAITSRTSNLGRNVFKIISIKFKGEKSGKIISVP